eukprot:Sdes_comp15737_c0_seq2m4775
MLGLNFLQKQFSAPLKDIFLICGNIFHVFFVCMISLSLTFLLMVRNFLKNGCGGPFSWRTVYYMTMHCIASLFPWHESDSKRDALAIIRRKGYRVEEHHCVTKDGFILTLHRIPHANNTRVRFHSPCRFSTYSHDFY